MTDEITEDYIRDMVKDYDKDDLTIATVSSHNFHWQNQIVLCPWVYTRRSLSKRMNWQFMNAVMWYIAP